MPNIISRRSAQSGTFKRMLLGLVVVSMCVILRPLEVVGQGERGGSGQITGKVTDNVSGDPINLANVKLQGTNAATTTDRNGNFSFQGLTPGRYAVAVRRVGYRELIQRNIQIGAGAVVDIQLQLHPLAVRLRDITVTPGSYSLMEAGSTQQTMTREDIESVPQFGEDIFRAVKRIPGLTSGDFEAHFSIRGGRRDETLILLDGLEIYEPYHLKDFNEGAISIVDVETIEGVELLTGGFSAKYGNKRSGVFNMLSRDSRGQRPSASVGFSFMNARAMAHGGFAGNRGSWFVSGRRGYLDLVFKISGIDDLPSPFYYDAFSKVSYDLHDRHTVSFNFLHARDQYTVDKNSTTGFQDSIPTREEANNRYGNTYAWLTLESQFSSRLSMTSLFSGGLVTTSRDGSEFRRLVPDTIYAIENVRDFNVLAFKQDWLLELSNDALVEFGFDVRRLNAEYTILNSVRPNPDNPVPDSVGFYPQITQSTSTGDGTLAAAYVSNRLRILDPFTLEVGLRYDRSTYSEDSDWSPRINGLFHISDASSLRLGWGYYRQTQAIADQAALDGLGRYFPSELSQQWTAGFEHLAPGGSVSRIEIYYKRGSSLRPVFRNWKGAIDVFPETDEDRILVYPDSSASKGIEFYHATEIGNRISLRGSYAFAIVDEHVSRIDNLNDPTPLQFNETHPAPRDQRHAINLDVTYRPAPTWSVNVSSALHTGWPATLESIRQVTGPNGPEPAILPETLWADRLPYYHRMDVRVTKRAGNLRMFAEIVNLTNRSNVFGYDYFRGPGANGQVGLQRDKETWFPILPSLGISWSRTF